MTAITTDRAVILASVKKSLPGYRAALTKAEAGSPQAMKLEQAISRIETMFPELVAVEWAVPATIEAAKKSLPGIRAAATKAERAGDTDAAAEQNRRVNAIVAAYPALAEVAARKGSSKLDGLMAQLDALALLDSAG
jgi:hypothetical protein